MAQLDENPLRDRKLRLSSIGEGGGETCKYSSLVWVRQSMESLNGWTIRQGCGSTEHLKQSSRRLELRGAWTGQHESDVDSGLISRTQDTR